MTKFLLGACAASLAFIAAGSALIWHGFRQLRRPWL